MRKITKYVSDDGIEFTTKKECEEYESFDNKIKLIEETIPKLPDNDDCSFGNGKGFLQWSKDLFNKVKNEILDIGYVITNEKVYLESKKVPHCHGIVGIYISDSSDSRIKRLQDVWGRLMHIDGEYREWGQGYFALHPDKAEHIKLN